MTFRLLITGGAGFVGASSPALSAAIIRIGKWSRSTI